MAFTQILNFRSIHYHNKSQQLFREMCGVGALPAKLYPIAKQIRDVTKNSESQRFEAVQKLHIMVLEHALEIMEGK